MRIRRVLVEGLFGFFRHDIQLNDDEPITIVYGPNGFGKTIILRMLDGLLNGQFEIFDQIPFDAFTLFFDDGSQLRLDRGRPDEPLLCFTSPKQSDKKSVVKFKEFRNLLFPDESPFLGQLVFARGLFLDTTEEDEEEDARKREITSWWGNIYNQVIARLIETQRLEIEYAEKGKRSRASRRQGARRPTVASHSEELADKIQDTLARYASRSQELDRTFPTRLLEQSGPIPEADELQDKLATLEEKRAHLARLGFLDPEESMTLPASQAVEKKRDVLAVYVADAEKKLAVFDEMAAKIELLTGIINDLFLYKRMHISREKGYVFTSHVGQEIQPCDLSSGEQHQLVLLYELLFQTKPGSLVLIDEPEISLHVAWQERFLDDLMKVAKLSKFDALVATHSAEIIGEHWDLAVNLRGPDQDTEEPAQESVS